jgi:hypothetical protein
VSIPQPPGLGRLESSAKGKRLSHTQAPLNADGSLSRTATRSTVIGPVIETMIESGARGGKPNQVGDKIDVFLYAHPIPDQHTAKANGNSSFPRSN